MTWKKAPEGGMSRNARLLAYADLLDAGQPVDEAFIPLVKEIVGEHLLERKELLDMIEKLGVKGTPDYDVKPLAKMVMGLAQDQIASATDLGKMVRELVSARRAEGQAGANLMAQLLLNGLLGGNSGPSDIGDLPGGPIN